MVKRATDWDASLSALRDEYPTATDGILWCVHQLSRDPQLTIKDFRDEAAGHGIKLGGRSLHSARVLLALDQPAATSPKKGKNRAAMPARLANGSAEDLEATLIDAIQQIQGQATAESRRLREAIQKAVLVLNEALKG